MCETVLSRSSLKRVGKEKPFEKQHRTVNREKWIVEVNLWNIGEGKVYMMTPGR